MKLINNDFRVLDTYVKSKKEEAYLVERINQPGQVFFLKILEPHKSNRCIQNFIENFKEYENISHRFLLGTYEFGLIESLNLKPISGRLYYALSEYTFGTTLADLKDGFSSLEVAKIMAQLMEVLDYLHFRGFTYRALSPEKVYLSTDGEIKLLNISTLTEYFYEKERINSIQEFIAPEFFNRDSEVDYKADYYSLGIMINKYLLPLLDQDSAEFREIESMTDEMLKKDPGNRNLNLSDTRKTLERLFSFNTGTDFLKERDVLQLVNSKAIGHESELLELEQLEELVDSNNSIYNMVMIEGSLGSGKSYLLDAFLRKASLRGAFTKVVDISGGKSIGFDTFRDFLLDMLSASELQFKLTKIDDIITIKHDELEKEFSLSLPGSLFKLYDLLAESLINRSKIESIFIGINDIEVSNTSILGMLDFLLAKFKGSRILVIATYNQTGANDKDAERQFEDWISRNSALRIKTSNLSLEATGRFVKSMLGIAFIPKNFSQILYKESLGNPRYLIHLLRHFHDSGELYMSHEGAWTILRDRYDDLDFPKNFRDAYRSRVASLDAKQLDLLQIIACFEGPGRRDIVKRLFSFSDNELDFSVDDAESQGMIYEEATEYGIGYIFTEGEIKKYIYSSMPQTQRDTYHSYIAAEILSLKKRGIDYSFEELFFQLSSSQQFEELVELIYEKISSDKNRFTDSSIMILTRAYELLASSNNSAYIEILDKLCYSLIVKGDIEQLKHYLEQLLKSSLERGDERYYIRGMLYELELMVRGNDLIRSQELMNEISSKLKGKSYPEEEIYHKLLQSKHYLDVDNPAQTAAMADDGIVISESNEIWTYIGDLYNIRGIAKYMAGDPEAAIEDYNKALDGYNKSDRPFDMVKPINNIGSIQSEYYGSEKVALDYYWRSVEISENYGLTSLQTTFLSNIGEAYTNVREYRNAEVYLDRAIELSRRINDKKSLFLSTVLQGVVYLRLGRINKARETHLSLKEMNRSGHIQDKEVLMQYTNFLGQFYLEAGDFRLSKEFSYVSMERSSEISKKEYMKAKTRLIYIEFLESHKIDEAAVTEIVNEFRKSGSSYDRAYFLLLYGLIAHSLNYNELSKVLLEEFKSMESIDIVEKFKSDLELIEMIIAGDKSSLLSAMEFSQSRDFDLVIPRFYTNIALGTRLLELGLFHEAFKIMMTNLGQYEITSRMLGEDDKGPDFKGFFMLNLIIPIIDDCLFQISGIRREFEPTIENYINKLDEDLFLRIFARDNAASCCKDTSKLLGGMDSNANDNLDKILEYAAIKTNAQFGYIVIYNSDDNDDRIIKYGTDMPYPLNMIVENTIKEGERILIKKDISSKQCHLLEPYFDGSISGFIAVPILTSPGTKGQAVDRRQSIIRNKVYGYIALFTLSNINRFDIERLDLINDLTWLIYLNSENDRLYRGSFFDKLTGTFRRNIVERRLNDAIQHYSLNERGFACMMVDVDRFKSINDTYGHQVGDKVLTAMGDVIKSSIRSTDTAGRYGGEEFLLIVEDVDAEAAIAVAEKLRSSIEKMGIKGLKQNITASIGIALYPEDGQLPEDLILRADQAMYHAKEVLGRNSVALWNDNMGSIASKFKLEHDLIVGGFENDSDRISALSDTAILIRRKLTQEEKLELFLGYVLDSTKGHTAVFYLNSEDKLKRIAEKSKSTKTFSIEVSLDYSKKVMDTLESEIYIDWKETRESLGQNSKEYFSGAICPIVINGDAIGIIIVEAPLGKREFKQKDLKYIEVLGSVFSANLV